MAKEALKVFHELPTWAKGVIAVGALGIGWVLYSRIRNSIKKSQELAGEKQENKDFGSELAALSKAGIKPTYPDSQYTAWANEIEKAYSGCDPFLQSGISTGKVFKQLKNDADFAKLVTAWGIRSYKGCLFEKDFNGSFYQALNQELLGATRDALNMQLKANGITYRV